MAATAFDTAPMTTIKLYGQLRQFGRSYDLAVRTPAEALKALCVQIPGLERFISNARSRGLVFAVFRGKKNIGESELNYQGDGDIIIAPVVVGSKRAGILQTIIGAVLIVMSPFTNGATLAPGIALAAGGVIQMLSPQAQGLKSSAAPENTPGYAFGSAKNTVASGLPVPLCIGHRRWGGAIISAAIYAEDRV